MIEDPVSPLRGPASRLRTQGVRKLLADFADFTLVAEEAAGSDRKRASAGVPLGQADGRKIDPIAANDDAMAMGAATRSRPPRPRGTKS